MPADLVMKAMNAVHRALIRLAPRRFGHEALGMPVLELTTTGRLSGRPRSVMLTSPVREGDAIVVVASRRSISFAGKPPRGSPWSHSLACHLPEAAPATPDPSRGIARLHGVRRVLRFVAIPLHGHP